MTEQPTFTIDNAINFLSKRIDKSLSSKDSVKNKNNEAFYRFSFETGNSNLPKLYCVIKKCKAKYIVNFNPSYNFTIDNNQDDDDDNITFDEIFTDLKELLKVIFEIPKKYYYSKVLDSFLKIENKDLEKELICCKIIGNTGNKCSVCYDFTETKTFCNHYLCRECAHKSIKNCDCDMCIYDDKPYSLKCPICREFLTHL